MLMKKRNKILVLFFAFLFILSTIGYAFPASAAESNKKILKTRAEVDAVVNAAIENMDEEVVFYLGKSYNFGLLPNANADFIFNYVWGLNSSVEKEGDKSRVTCTIKYSPAGNLIKHYKKGEKLSTDEKTVELNKVYKKVMQGTKGKSNYELIVYFHDYLVQNAECNRYKQKTFAHNVFLDKRGDSDGFAEAYQMLLELSGIQSQVVKSFSNIDDKEKHFFNKVYLDQKWYNVDTSIDSPYTGQRGNATLRTYLLVTDTVVKQRYTWDEKKYPKATTKNNWHMRNKLVATNSAQLEKFVDNAIKNKKKDISIWIEKFTPADYDFEFLNKYSQLDEYGIRYISANPETETFATAIVLEFIYE